MSAKILIAEDEKDNRKVLKDFLKKANPDYEFIITKNGKEACEAADEERPDLILMDWRMPVMTGIEAVRHIKSQPPTQDIPIIMQTAETEDEKLNEAFEAGALDYIKKPISELELIARVNSALALRRAQNKVKELLERSEKLLLNILPPSVAEELKAQGSAKMRSYEQVSILFTDFKGFSEIAAQMPPDQLMEELNDCFSAFDEIIARHNLYKIKTIGDAYMCAGGIPEANTHNALDAVRAGLEMQAFMKKRFQEKQGNYWQCRLGINTGEIRAGVIGSSRFAYDIWGNAVNIASRMESSGEVYKVNISENTYQLVKDHFNCSYRGEIEAKNGLKLKMYFVEG